MTDNITETGAYAMPTPNPDMKSLNRLIGSWEVSGGVEGIVTYRWMEGGFFLIQDVELKQYGQDVKGIEIIGHVQPFGEEPSKDIKSRYYDSVGNTLDYVYEIDGDTLMIWGGEKGSPAYFKGEFSPDGNVNTGRWVYPDGGGYESTMTKIETEV